VTLFLAQIVFDLGRHDEARELCARARAISHPDDWVNFVYLDAIEGAWLARHGKFPAAELHGRRAVEHMKGGDFYDTRALAHRYQAEVLALAGRTREAEEEAATALAIREAKGDVTGAAREREILERLGLAVPRSPSADAATVS
jgi:tetratricopeptide (TPR) repeat protein